jgi:crossover junction endodeoxyribonuclease RuvC
MGLDPGSRFSGYGFIEVNGPKLSLIDQGRIAAPAAWPFPKRLAHIHLGLLAVIRERAPEAMAVEDVFTFKNPKTALKLAQARGVGLLAAELAGVPIFEYTPSQIKNAVAGRGLAEKSQVAFMVKQILGEKIDFAADASDALACAICHANQKPLLTALGGKTGKSRGAKWSDLSPDDLAAMGFKVASS